MLLVWGETSVNEGWCTFYVHKLIKKRTYTYIISVILVGPDHVALTGMVHKWHLSRLNIFVLHVHLSSDAVSFSLSLKHIFKSLQVDFWGILSCLGLDTLISLFFHFLTGTIVSVGISILDHLFHVVYDLWEVVTGVSHLVWVNVQSLEVALDVLDELNLLIHWIGVIKPEDHLTLINLRVVIVEHSGLNVTDVEETTWLWGEPGDNLSLFSSFQSVLVVCVRSVLRSHIFLKINY